MDKKLLVVYTGGTIGSVQTSNGYAPVSGLQGMLEQCISPHTLEQLPAFDVLELDDALESANLIPSDWVRISELLLKHWKKYDGFIVLHGTDTMAYTASALSFLLQGIDKPVIITGSQIPLSEVRNDGRENLISALWLAGRYSIPEVTLYFHDRLLRGNRSRKVSSSELTAFDSPNYPWLASMGINAQFRKDLILQPSGERPRLSECLSTQISPEFRDDEVRILTIYPGISEKMLRSVVDHEQLKGLIIQSYGVGNLPDISPGFIRCLEQVVDKGVTVVNMTQCPKGAVYQGTYALGSVLGEIGVLSGLDMTLEASFTKLYYLGNQSFPVDEMRSRFSQNLCGELSLE